MRFNMTSAALLSLAIGISARSIQPQTDFEKCSTLLCTCDFAAKIWDCAANFCNTLQPSTSSNQLSCSNDFLNTAAGECCSSTDPAACLSSLQQTSSVCNGGKGSVEELRRREQARKARASGSKPDDDENQKRQYSYDNYSTGGSYDEDESGCAWNFDGASAAGACDTPSTYDSSYGSTYDGSGGDSGGDSTLLSGAEKNTKMSLAMLVVAGTMVAFLF